MSVDLLSVAVNLCCHLVQCDAVDATMLSRQPVAALQGQIKPLWREVGMCPDDRGGGTKAPCSSAVLTTPGHLYVPFAKRRKCLSSPFQGGKHWTLTTAEGIQRMPGRVKVSVCDVAPSQRVSVESQHKPHTTRHPVNAQTQEMLLHLGCIHLHVNFKKKVIIRNEIFF